MTGMLTPRTEDECADAADVWIERSREFDPHDGETSVRSFAEAMYLFCGGMPMLTALAAEGALFDIREKERQETQQKQEAERRQLCNNQRQRLHMTPEEYAAFRAGDTDSKRRPLKVQIRHCPRCDLELPEDGPCPMGQGRDCRISAGPPAGFKWLQPWPDTENPIV